MFSFPPSEALNQAKFVLETLNNVGFSCYFVGGCVRDALLHRPIYDFDLCTDALPYEIQELFPKTVDTGAKFGTITVISKKISIEVTTFRGESTYSDGRHPDSVSFSHSLAEDLQRRDFTINAMAFHPEEGIIDPFSGEIDLNLGQLRTVEDPYTRFSEDYLRILRALRFAATLNLDIQGETADAILATFHPLAQVTRERLTLEMKKMVMGEFLHKITAFYPVLEETVFCGIPCLWEAENSQEMELKLNEISKAPPLLTLRLGMFISLFDPQGDFLRLSKEEQKEVDFFCEMPCLPWKTRGFFLETLQKYGRESTKRLLFYQKHQFPYHRDEIKELEELLSSKHCTCLEELAINGNDLIARGVKGQMIGKLLQTSLKLVLSGEIKNDKEEILSTIFGEERPVSN